MLHETIAVSIFARTSALTTSCLWLHCSNTDISYLLSDIQAKERLLTVQVWILRTPIAIAMNKCLFNLRKTAKTETL